MAGWQPRQHLKFKMEMNEKYFDRILNTNFKGPVFLTQHLVRLMEDAGAIVNTSSTSKGQSFPGLLRPRLIKSKVVILDSLHRQRNLHRAEFGSTQFLLVLLTATLAMEHSIKILNSSSPCLSSPYSPESANPKFLPRYRERIVR